MTQTVESKALETLTMIAADMAEDARAFDGKPFNGRTVAEYLGNQGAAIAALANIMKLLVQAHANGLRMSDFAPAEQGRGA
jgi:hypothetical protein